VKTTSTLSYQAGQRSALGRMKIANLRNLAAPTLAGAAIGGVGGAAMAPEGDRLKGALIGGSMGAVGGAGGGALGHMMGQSAVDRSAGQAAHLMAGAAKGQPLDMARAKRIEELAHKALGSQSALRDAGGALGAGAGGYLGASAASKLRPQEPGLLPYEDDPYYMSQMQPMPSR
jgi:hypothetical protein